MRRTRVPLAYAAFLSLALGLSSCDPGGRPSGTIDNGWPPTRYRADAVVDRTGFVGPDLIAGHCAGGVVPAGAEIEACTRLEVREGQIVRATMILPNPCDGFEGEVFARLACHEIGHLNGWPANHGR